MIGAYLNGFGILLGALIGLARRKPVTARTQDFFKNALGVLTIFFGLRLVYENTHGTFLLCLMQILIAALAVILGYWIGWAMRLQKLSNRVGHHASTLLKAAEKRSPGSSSDGFVAATLLFCAAPLGFLGAATDGLEKYSYLFLLKAIMDGLAMMSFVKMFRWPVALAAIPVFFFFNGLTRAASFIGQTWLAPESTAYVCVAAGMIACTVALVIFGTRKVELTNYLPALAVAPLLGHWFS